jgi:addiction module toxin, RelE/StbE family
MKYEVIPSSRFKKDLRLAEKRGRNISLITEVVKTLASGKPLPEKNRDHALTGNWIGFRECHILPDWLLVYQIDENKLYLYLTRTGTHSDLGW